MPQQTLRSTAVYFSWHTVSGSGSHFDFMTILLRHNTVLAPPPPSMLLWLAMRAYSLVLGMRDLQCHTNTLQQLLEEAKELSISAPGTHHRI